MNWRDDWVTAVPSLTFPSIRFWSRDRSYRRARPKSRLSEVSKLVELSESINDDELKMRAISIDAYISAEIGDRARVDLSLVAMNELGEVRQRLHATVDCAPWCRDDGDPRWGFRGCGRPCEREGLKLARLISGDQNVGVYGIQMFSIRREQGRLAEVAPVVKRSVDENPVEKAWLPGFALIAADLGFEGPARRRLRELAETGFELPFDAKRSASLSDVAEVACMLGETDAAARVYELMSVYRYMTITAGIATVCYGAASRYLECWPRRSAISTRRKRILSTRWN